jgi:hypothetical protein
MSELYDNATYVTSSPFLTLQEQAIRRARKAQQAGNFRQAKRHLKILTAVKRLLDRGIVA